MIGYYGLRSKGGGETKPTRLAQDATHAQAMAKLDEITAYPGTPGSVGAEDRRLKPGRDNASVKSNWTIARAQAVTLINDLIDQIP